MSIEVVAELWNAIKVDLEYNSVGNAADSLVNVLIDHDFTPADIKAEFRRDKDVMEALESYIDDHPEDEEDDADYDEEEDEEDSDADYDSGW